MAELEVTGYWWLPDAEDNKVPGTLRFDHGEGLRLELIESFTDDLQTDEAYPLVLGLGTNGEVVTLHGCMWVRSKRPTPGVDSKEFMARTCYLGHHFAGEEQLRFWKVKVQFSQLANWTELSGISEQYGSRELGQPEYRVTYDYPDDVVAVVRDAEITISHELQTGGAVSPGEIGFKESAFVQVELKSEIELTQWIRGFVAPLQNLLTLATARPNAITHLSVYSKGNSMPTATGEFHLPVSVVSNWLYRESKQIKRLFPEDMLFTLSDIQEDFGAVIQRWLGIHKDLDGVCDLFFSLKYREPAYVENRFLPLVQAAESYHRRRMRNQVLPPEEHQDKMTTILDSVPSDHRDWLEKKLKFSNDLSLVERLTDLIKATDEVISPLLGDTKKFIWKVADTRHYLTHYDQSSRKNAAEGAELFRLAEKVSFIVEACLLGELGLSPEKRRELFRRDKHYAFALRQAGSARV